MIPFEILSPWPLIGVSALVAAVLAGRHLLYGYLGGAAVLAAAGVMVVVLALGGFQLAITALDENQRSYRASHRVVQYPELAARKCAEKGSQVADVRAMHDGPFGDSNRYLVKCVGRSAAVFVPPFVVETINE